MFPPQQGFSIDIDALSGICGSMSIACWVVVFSPQIIENFRRQSADGLSLTFLVIWLLGDLANILGSIIQGVLPTMVILAVYYTLADIVLLCQCFYYRGFSLRSKKPTTTPKLLPARDSYEERRPLLHADNLQTHPPSRDETVRASPTSHRSRRSSYVDGTHLSPATPLLDPSKPNDSPALRNIRPTSTLQTIIFNLFAIILVCAAGVFGWWVSAGRHREKDPHHHDPSTRPPNDDTDVPATLDFNLVGQIFGYICAVLYLGSRIPQILLNYRRKSTEGVSLLFFLFACIGNLTYDMSIFAYSPVCANPRHCLPGEEGRIYAKYIAVNASWIAGSLGTLFLDLCVFAQFFLYRKREEGEYSGEEAVVDGSGHEQANGFHSNGNAVEGRNGN